MKRGRGCIVICDRGEKNGFLGIRTFERNRVLDKQEVRDWKIGGTKYKEEANQYVEGVRKVQMSGPSRKRRARGLSPYLLDMARCTSNPVPPQMLFLPFTCTICEHKPPSPTSRSDLFLPCK